jgi:hypothetical protein
MTEEVKATKFTLVDKDGRTRGSMFVDEHDQPVLVLMDGDGTRRVRMAVDSHGWGAALQFFDQDGKESVTLSEDLGEPSLILGKEETAIFLQAMVRGPRVMFSSKPEVRVEGAKEGSSS